MKKLLLLLACLPVVALISCNKSTPSSTPNSTQEEVCIIPNITERGVEPFFVGSSLLEVPSKGSFYDTIVLNKLYDWYEVGGEMQGERYTETEYKRFCKEFGSEFLETKCYGFAKIIKDGDTIMTIDYDENAQITDITVLSDMLKMENGIHVGMGASDLLKDYGARFVTQTDWHDGHSSLSDHIIIDVPSVPKRITVFSECNTNISDFMNKKMEKSGNYVDFNYVYTLPSGLVHSNTVSKIKISNTAFDCYQ